MDESGIGPLSPSATPGPLDARRPGIQGSLDAHVLEGIRPISGVLALLYAGFTVAFGILTPPDDVPYLMAGAAVTCALLLILWMGLRRWAVSPSSAHPLATGLAALVLGNSLLPLIFTGEPRHTSTLVLLVLGVGVLFLDAGWFALVVSVAVAGWAVVAATSPAHPEWAHYGATLAAAVLLASTVMAIRIRTMRGLEQLRRRDRIRQLELESALQRTERARQGEVEARRALEGAVQEARESEERFRRLAEATAEGVSIIQDGRVVEANGRMATLLNLPRIDLIGSDFGAPLRRAGDGEDPLQIVGSVLDSGASTAAVEVEVQRAGGGTFPAELSLAPTVHAHHPAVVAVLRDVTEPRRLEAILRDEAREAEAHSRAKSAFLATMSHELRTPLNAVIGFSNVLRKNAPGNLSERDLDYLGRIVANGRHLLSVIEDILDLSKIEAGRIEVQWGSVEVEELVGEVVASLELQAQRKGIELRADVAPGLAPLVTDRQRLQQVLLNLAGNAVKFTGQGGVVVRVLGDRGTFPTVIEVEDTGMGIPDDHLEAIFEPFRQVDDSTTRAFGGAGLGLSISRSLCTLLGYRLQVRSHSGQGSVFSIRLAPPSGGTPSPGNSPGAPAQGTSP